MSYAIDIQIACDNPLPISKKELTEWVTTTLSTQKPSAELTLRIVSSQEIQELNATYRQKDKPTNVLAFPADLPEHIDINIPLLGDVILCPDVIQTESETLHTPLKAHWAHIVIHGVLHLLGYDHITLEDAKIMQPLETKLLAMHGFDNPYHFEE